MVLSFLIQAMQAWTLAIVIMLCKRGRLHKINRKKNQKSSQTKNILSDYFHYFFFDLLALELATDCSVSNLSRSSVN